MTPLPQIQIFKLLGVPSEKKKFLYENNYRIIFLKNTVAESNLIFVNPLSSLEAGLYREGCACVFSTSFFTKNINDKLDVLFSENESKTVYHLDKKQELLLESIFKKMLSEINSLYAYRDDLLRNYISEITHIVVKSLVTKISV